MITAYWVCLAFGGTLLLASVFLGHDSDVDAPDVDFDADLDADGHAGEVDVAGVLGWMPITSVRFWIFFLAFFGLTGVLLVLTKSATSMYLHLPISGGVGYFAGIGAVSLLKKVQEKRVDGAITEQDYIGETAVVTVVVSPDKPGKVRLEIKDQMLELLATSDEHTFAAGQSVLIYEVNNKGFAVVTKPTA